MSLQRPLKQNERVKVYRNLHKKCLSVQGADGRVAGHVDHIVLKNVKFVVRPAGRKRVLETRKKNVHAFAVGTVVSFQDHSNIMQFGASIRYNPYEAETFMTTPRRGTVAQPIHDAKLVQVSASGAIWAL